MHDTFAHFEEDVLTHGHPESYDDAILESGNHLLAKGMKALLFWGGTSEKAADGSRPVYHHSTRSGRRGSAIFKAI